LNFQNHMCVKFVCGMHVQLQPPISPLLVELEFCLKNRLVEHCLFYKKASLRFYCIWSLKGDISK